MGCSAVAGRTMKEYVRIAAAKAAQQRRYLPGWYHGATHVVQMTSYQQEKQGQRQSTAVDAAATLPARGFDLSNKRRWRARAEWLAKLFPRKRSGNKRGAHTQALSDATHVQDPRLSGAGARQSSWREEPPDVAHQEGVAPAHVRHQQVRGHALVRQPPARQRSNHKPTNHYNNGCQANTLLPTAKCGAANTLLQQQQPLLCHPCTRRRSLLR
jgi:hypothetical protein